MRQQKNQHLLKIFSGPHIGAEILLKPGSYSIGKGADCDIVLQDEMIGSKHARITVNDDNSISVATMNEQPVLLDGVPVLIDDNMPQVAVEQYKTLTLGTTHFALGKPNGDWSKIRFPSLLRKADLAIAKPTRAEDIQKSDGSLVSTLSLYLETVRKAIQAFFSRTGFSAPTRKKKSGVQSSTAARKASKGTFSKAMDSLGASKLVRSVKIFSAVLLGITIGLAPAVSSFTQVKVKDQPDYLLLETIESVLNKPQFAGVRAASITESDISIEGYVATESDRRELQAALNQAGLNPVIKVRVGSQLARSADTILKVLGFSQIQVAYLAHGKLNAAGYSPDKAAWENAKETLLTDIPGLEGVVDEDVQDFTARQEVLNKYISKNGLGEKLATKTKENEEITVYGVLGADEISKWHNILAEFRTKYGALPVIHSKVHDTREVIEVAIKSVRIGDVPYIVTQDNSKYLEGSVLPNGYTVKEIRADKILLSKNSVEAVYSLAN